MKPLPRRGVSRQILLALVLWAAPAPPATAQVERRYDEAIAHGQGVLQRLVDDGQLPGVAVAVAVDAQIVWSEGFGVADIASRRPAERSTLFGVGSISKTFTMAGALRLVDAGLLALDTPVERWLADFPHAGRGITLRLLAAHQSGLSDDFAAANYRTDRHFPTLREAYHEIRNERLTYEPGTRLEYATGLYTLIGRVMEVAAGAEYPDLMKRWVFAPAGMRDVVPHDARRPPARRTSLYVEREGGFEPAPFFDPSFKLPGAGYLATAEDVARLGSALLDTTFLSAAARAEMFRPVPLADGTATEFALGLRRGEHNGRELLHLPGGGPGISSWLYIYPAERLVIALLSNVPTGPVGGRTHDEIAGAFLAALD